MDQLKSFCLKLLGRKPSRDRKKRISHPMPLPVPNFEAEMGSAPVIPPPPPPKPSKRNSVRNNKPPSLSKPEHYSSSATSSRHRYTRYYASLDRTEPQSRRQRHAEDEERTAFNGLSLSQDRALFRYPRDSSPSSVNLSTKNGRLQNSVAIKQQLLAGAKFREVPGAHRAVYVHQDDHYGRFVTPEIVTTFLDDTHPRGSVPNATLSARTSSKSDTTPKTRRYSPKNLALYPNHIARAMVANDPQPRAARLSQERPPQQAYPYKTPMIVNLARGPQSKGLRNNIYGQPIPDPGIFINNGKNGSHWKPYNPHPDHYAIDKKTGRRRFRSPARWNFK